MSVGNEGHGGKIVSVDAVVKVVVVRLGLIN